MFYNSNSHFPLGEVSPDDPSPEGIEKFCSLEFKDNLPLYKECVVDMNALLGSKAGEGPPPEKMAKLLESYPGSKLPSNVGAKVGQTRYACPYECNDPNKSLWIGIAVGAGGALVVAIVGTIAYKRLTE